MQERIYRKFFKSKYQKMKDYDAIFNSEKSKKRVRIILYLFYLLALIFVFLNANNGIAVYESGINVNSHYFDVTGNFYSYSDIVCLDAEFDENNSEYELYLDDTQIINIGMYADCNDIENKIIPILESNQVEIIRSNTE